MPKWDMGWAVLVPMAVDTVHMAPDETPLAGARGGQEGRWLQPRNAVSSGL